MDYGFAHDGKVYTPNGTQGIGTAENETRNKALETRELERIATAPERITAYYDFPEDREMRGGTQYASTFRPSLRDAHVTTWMGTRIGTITSARVYLHNWNSRMVSMNVTINGIGYYGRASWDHGTCINLRRAKG